MMLRFTFTLLCMLAVKTVVTLPVSKSAEEPALSVLPLHKTSQQEFEQQGVVQQEQQTTELKEQILPEQAQVKSAPSEQLLEKESIPLQKEDNLEKLAEIKITEDEKKPLEKKLEIESQKPAPVEQILTKSAVPETPEVAPPVVPATQGEPIQAKSNIPEVAIESEAKNAPIPADLPKIEDKKEEVKEEKKLQHEDVKPVVPAQEPIAEVPLEQKVEESVPEKIEPKSVAKSVASSDEKATDRVTREAEEAARKQAEATAAASVIVKSQKEVPELQPLEKISEEKAKSLESKVVEEKKSVEPVPAVPAQETHEAVQDAPKLKSQIVEDKPVAIEEAVQPQGTQQIAQEPAVEVKEAKSADEGLKTEKAELLPKPEKIKESIQLPMKDMEDKKEVLKEKIEKSSEESSEEKSSEEIKEKPLSSSRSDSSEASSSS